MGDWGNVGKKGAGEGAFPMLKVEADKPVRIHVLAVPGTKYAGPEERWQHWPNAGDPIKQPIACAGARSGCLFHQEPLKWALRKSYLLNVVAYEMENGVVKNKRVVAFAGNQVIEMMKNQADMIGVDAGAVDWVIGKTGTGKTTTWSASIVPVLADPNYADLTQYPAQAAEFADAQYPMLVDFDKMDGYNPHTTPAMQSAWYDAATTSAANKAADAATAATGETPATPPAAPTTPPPGATGAVIPALTLPPIAPPPVAAAPAVVTPPPASAPAPPAPPAAPPAPVVPAGPSAEEIAAAQTLLASWNADYAKHLAYIQTTPGFSAAHVAAAKLLESVGSAPAAPPAPVAAAPAAATQDEATMRTRLSQALQTYEVFKDFAAMKKFFQLCGPDKGALRSLDVNDLAKLLGIIDQGEASIKAAIA